MNTRQPSFSARSCAVARAVHLVLDGEPRILNDTLAEALAGFDRDDKFGVDGSHWRHPDQLALRTHTILRSRYIEDELAARFSSRPGQYVILGAGLDSFAYRRPAALEHIQVFEVDHPSTQEYKLRRLAEISCSVGLNVHHVPIDFESESFSEKLQLHGFDSDLATLFSFLGVCPYLSREALQATVAEILGCMSDSCALVMDFALPPNLLTQEDREDLARRMTYAKDDEPWLSLYSPTELGDLLLGAGFNAIELLSPERAMTRYFSGRKDGLRLCGAYHLIAARRG